MDQPYSIETTLDYVPSQNDQESQLIKRNAPIQQIISLGLVETKLNKTVIAKIDVKNALESFLQGVQNFSIKMGGVFLFAVAIVMKKKFIMFNSDIRDFYDNFLKSSIPSKPKTTGQNKKSRNIKRAAEDIAEEISQRKMSSQSSFQMINDLSNQAIDNPRFMSKPNEVTMQEDIITPLKFQQLSQNNSAAGSDIKSTNNFRAQLMQTSGKNYKELTESLIKMSGKGTPVSQSMQDLALHQEQMLDEGQLQFADQSWGQDDYRDQVNLEISSNFISQMDQLLKEKLETNQMINLSEDSQDQLQQNQQKNNRKSASIQKKSKKTNNKWHIDDEIDIRKVNQQPDQQVRSNVQHQKDLRQELIIVNDRKDQYKELLDQEFLNNIEEKFQHILNLQNNKQLNNIDNQVDVDYIIDDVNINHNSTADFTNMNDNQEMQQQFDINQTSANQNGTPDKSGQAKNISELFNITVNNNTDLFKQNNSAEKDDSIELNEKDKKEFLKHEKFYNKVKNIFAPLQKTESFTNISKKIKGQKKGQLFYEMLILAKLGKVNIIQKDQNFGEIQVSLSQ